MNDDDDGISADSIVITANKLNPKNLSPLYSSAMIAAWIHGNTVNAALLYNTV